MFLISLFFACTEEAPKKVEPPPPAPTTVSIPKEKLAGFSSLPSSMNDEKYPSTPALVDLGRTLYYETRLSKSQTISCNSCHLLDKYGVDGLATSTGFKAQKGGRNAPTTYNAAGHLAQFWDGRAADVEAQAKGPVLNPIEMAMPDDKFVVSTVKSIPGYEPLFAAAFPGDKDPITYDHMAQAIGAFERGLVTPSAWDRFLAGDDKALTEAQKKGFNTFTEIGCNTCHTGTYVGGSMYMKAGLVTPWPNTSDEGRFVVTKNEADKMLFKVPSLRNIEETAPYFHDGSVTDLNVAIQMMGKHQLGRDLTPVQIAEIRAWLGSLKGEIPTAYITAPAQLPAGPKTPKPVVD